MCTIILYDILQSCSTVFLHEKASLCYQCILKSMPHETTSNELLISHYILHVPVLSSYVCDHPASLRVSANADLLPHSSVWRQLCASVPRQTSALESLLVCYFHFLYITMHYTYRMLILPHVQGACASPPWGVTVTRFHHVMILLCDSVEHPQGSYSSLLCLV